MKNTYSRLGLLLSLLIHGSVIAAAMMAINMPKPQQLDKVESISIEMLAARLEQPQVATAPDLLETAPEPAPEQETKPTPPEPMAMSKPEKPKIKPKLKEKLKEKPKEKPPIPKEKPKEPPKEKPKDNPKPIKALERGVEVKQGIVAKVVPNAHQGTKVQTGTPQGSTNGNPMGKSTTGMVNPPTSSGVDFGAYRTNLQKALQRKAHNTYPTREKMMRKTGVVTLSFNISATGQLTNVQVVKSSGNSNLDAAAVKAAQSVKTEPPPTGYPALTTVPVSFSIN